MLPKKVPDSCRMGEGREKQSETLLKWSEILWGDAPDDAYGYNISNKSDQRIPSVQEQCRAHLIRLMLPPSQRLGNTSRWEASYGGSGLSPHLPEKAILNYNNYEGNLNLSWRLACPCPLPPASQPRIQLKYSWLKATCAHLPLVLCILWYSSWQVQNPTKSHALQIASLW